MWKSVWLAALCGVALAAAPRPLMVKAWRKTGKPREYPTRILSHLSDFTPPREIPLDRFGGWKVRRFKPTGFFYAKKVDGRWWLVDPEGYPFLHIAVNSVRHGTSPKNRRAFPKKFGSLENWREATLQLLRSHGFNGTGCWSEDGVLRRAPRPLAYTPQWNFMSSYGRKRGGTYQLPGHTGYPNGCIFVFDPEFEKFADEHARKLEATSNDPWLLGHFSDNELPFPRDSLDRYLRLPPTDPGHKEAVRWLRQRKGSKRATITNEDREAWRGHVAETYFRIVSRAIKRHDPNHLYLGSRFHGSEKRSQAVFEAAGKHLDVVSINLYGVWTPTPAMLRRWEQWSGRPLLITEWYAKGADSGLPNLTGAGWTVPTQRDRGFFYQNFVLGLIESRVCVGWHWFKYMDNDPEDTRADPSNRDSNKGIVTPSYEPWQPLLDAMREINSVTYPLTTYFDARRGGVDSP